MNFLKDYPRYKWALATLDFLLMLLAFVLTLRLRFPDDLKYLQHTSADQWPLYISFSFLCLFYFQYANLYKIQNILHKVNHLLLLMKSIFFVVIGFIIFQFVIHDFKIDSRLFYLYFFLIACFLFVVFRIPFLELLGGVLLSDRVVIIGAGKKGRRLAEIFRDKSKVHHVVGFLDDAVTDSGVTGCPVLGKIEDAVAVADRLRVDSFILAIDLISRKRFFEIFEFLHSHNLGFQVSSDYVQVLYDKLNIDIYDEFGMARFPAMVDDNRFFRVLKRSLDIVMASAGILLLSPLFLALGLLVAVTSPGGVFYSQIRIGRNGKPFYFYKFRSMYLDSDKDKSRKEQVNRFIRGEMITDDGATKIVNKSRVTSIGHFLRKYSLDELPQLFNVLKGDMSLVGPRPCLLSEWKVYEKWQKYRLNNTPGCTGIWQVYGRSKVDFEETVLMDIYYNKNSTPWLDFQILLKTIPVMLLGKGGE